MTAFIELTNALDNTKICLNIENISSFSEDPSHYNGGNTMVWAWNGMNYVKETYDEIVKMIKQISHCNFN